MNEQFGRQHFIIIIYVKTKQTTLNSLEEIACALEMRCMMRDAADAVNK